MGVDIHGWVEVKSWDDGWKWFGVLRIDAFVYGNKYGFGSMFLDDEMFQPIAKGRGLPEDISEEAKLSRPEEDWGHTWAYWYEIMTIDWEAVYTPPSPSVIKYTRNTAGDFLLEWHKYLHEMQNRLPLDYTKDSETDIGDARYVVVHQPSVRRKETLAAGWQIVFDAMRFIASRHPKNNDEIRLVVWFNG